MTTPTPTDPTPHAPAPPDGPGGRPGAVPERWPDDATERRMRDAVKEAWLSASLGSLAGDLCGYVCSLLERVRTLEAERDALRAEVARLQAQIVGQSELLTRRAEGAVTPDVVRDAEVRGVRAGLAAAADAILPGRLMICPAQGSEVWYRDKHATTIRGIDPAAVAVGGPGEGQA